MHATEQPINSTLRGKACPDVRKNKSCESYAAIIGRSGVKHMHAMDQRLANQRDDDEHHRQENGARSKRGSHESILQSVCHYLKPTCQKFVSAL